MPHYQSLDPTTELNGRTVYAFISNINYEDIEETLAKHHLNAVEQDKWYKLQDVFDVLSDITDNPNGSENLIAIGIAASELSLSVLPEAYSNYSVEQWLRAYAESIYPSRHRNGRVGTIVLDKTSDNHLIITTEIPYPDDLMYGVFYAYIRYFIPETNHFVLAYAPGVQRREEGGTQTVYHVHITD